MLCFVNVLGEEFACHLPTREPLKKSVEYESSARYGYKLWGIPFGTLYLLIQG